MSSALPPLELLPPAEAGPSAAASSPAGARSGWDFALTISLGAFLLFLVQPLIGKYILPWFGGSPAVWTTCMLFFQVLLLCGYAYAHLTARLLRPRVQVAIHVFLLLASLALLPVVPSEAWKPQGDAQPVVRILLLLLVSVGLPYFVLSATSPLIQAWFARVHSGASPYRLFALSNAGSLFALLGFPFLLEPTLSRGQQAMLWSTGLVLFVGCCAACGVRLLRAPASKPQDLPNGPDVRPAAPFDVALWLLMPAVASLLLLATTNTLCQDVAVVPFLWLVPLAAYLLSFIVAFEHPRWYRRGPFILLMLVTLIGSVGTWSPLDGGQLLVQVGCYTLLLFACCAICHGEVARLRPHPRRLTGYYLTIATGGALGGVLVAVVAPLVFDRFLEFQLGLVACSALLLAVLLRDVRKTDYSPLYLVPPVLLALMWSGYCAYAAAGMDREDRSVLARSRNFYGVLSVREQTDVGSSDWLRILYHGRIRHGGQHADPQRRREPLFYYTPESGASLAIQHDLAGDGRRIGVVGLGAGTLAAFGRPADRFTFYEINPAVERLAREQFTYLEDCPSQVEVLLGDGRLTLERQSDQDFDLIFLDAFSGDAVPVHLLTREAFEVYLRHLTPDGVVCVNVTNRYLDLAPVVRRHADDLGLHAILVAAHDNPRIHQYDSEWVLLSRDPLRLVAGKLREAARPVPDRPDLRPWTDDRASLLQVLRR